MTWQEQYLYGSSRLGSIEPGVSWTSAPAATPHFRANRTLQHGWHRYELTDHLGNVRAALNGRRTIYNPTDTAQLYYVTNHQKCTTHLHQKCTTVSKLCDVIEMG